MWRNKVAVAVITLALGGATVVVWVVYLVMDRSPGELLRYAERRLYGHTKLEWVLMPPLREVRAQVERPVPQSPLPSLGKGVRQAIPQQIRFDPSGRPSADWTYGTDAPPAERSIYVNDVPSLHTAMRQARAGDTIAIAPGTYRVKRALGTVNAGSADHPVVVRAIQPGSVRLEIEAGNGFMVTHPYWVFENLDLRGVCTVDDYCEHAFHIMGNARGTVIRNNAMQEFSAHIKVNGLRGMFPDDGLIQHNTITNSRTRLAEKPVTPIDIVAASRWTVADNVIADFVKRGSDGQSYGVYMKGAGEGGRIERNLVICTPRDVSEPAAKPGSGARVGISMGGGGSGPAYCRDLACAVEHTGGIIANNIVAHCNDFGIDINRSSQISIVHNTLINTAGVDIRGEPASADLQGNLIEGRIRASKGASFKQRDNQIGGFRTHQEAADKLDFGWLMSVSAVPTGTGASADFCRRPRGSSSVVGALTEAGSCP